MKRKLTSVDEFFQDDLNTPELRQAYREVLDEELGEVLRSLRKKRGLSQKDLAERLGVQRSRVAQIENTEGLSLSLETLARFASALGYRLILTFADEGEAVAQYSLSEAPAREREWDLAVLPAIRVVDFSRSAA
ncbi:MULTISPECIES: helix-turn-helix domain-containing protein [unclassified Meiothermus]|uniref:helix-turn-helix domain-containing protein n=1 Tax=unclassified Meiothermus TaxID=370471 RepID=UPI000D7BB18D|nr:MULTISPECIES: helix-turn-helix transcriptional regulator [unclassified Meiothermus]PZA06052.1 hypothetical protein DNA98_15460 [Meiothermus sp. Pnk-1]RYM36153.1 XRE family transcriptional regulator [Meiothermus sp. PNK-Is4]